MSSLLPASLSAQLRQADGPTPNNPLLLAKVIEDDGFEFYLISLDQCPHRGPVVTCFDPTFEPGYPTIALSWLEDQVRLCGDFRSARLSAIAPGWSQVD